MQRRVRDALAFTVVLLLLVQVARLFPPTDEINDVGSPIAEDVEFTVDPLFGITGRDGRLEVTFDCQATLSMGNADVEWFLLDGNRELASLEGGDAADACGDTWRLEPGTYTLRTYKTDGIRYDQSVEIHTLDPAAGPLSAIALVLGLAFWLRYPVD